MDILTTLLPLLSSAGDETIFGKIVVAIVVYYVARREVRIQFGSLNKQLGQIETALTNFGKKIIDLETKHDVRITKLEESVSVIRDDLTTIKDQKTGPPAKSL